MENINLIDLFYKHIKTIKVKDGEPCPHRGCLNHVTHPCEVCGRINGKGNVIVWNKKNVHNNR